MFMILWLTLWRHRIYTRCRHAVFSKCTIVRKVAGLGIAGPNPCEPRRLCLVLPGHSRADPGGRLLLQGWPHAPIHRHFT